MVVPGIRRTSFIMFKELAVYMNIFTSSSVSFDSINEAPFYFFDLLALCPKDIQFSGIAAREHLWNDIPPSSLPVFVSALLSYALEHHNFPAI